MEGLFPEPLQSCIGLVTLYTQAYRVQIIAQTFQAFLIFAANRKNYNNINKLQNHATTH
jgi:hypothetical protein